MKKGKILKVVIAVVFVATLMAAGICFLLQRQTYTTVETLKYYENVSLDNPGYEKYLNGVLKYTRDGIAFLKQSGEEIWNQPCQMNNPVVEIQGEIAIVCDRSGTSILVFEESGLKGEIKTTRPIERVSVSEQGIVAVILKDESTPQIVCYDATGNVLVEQNTSLDHTGYPLDVALSLDGNVLQVSYLMAESNGLRTSIVCYDFSGEDIDKKDFKIYEQVYDGNIVPIVDYLDRNTSILVADDQAILFKGKGELEELSRITFQELSNIAYDEQMIAMIVKEEASAYKLKTYNTSGELLSEVELEQEYTDIELLNDQIILYEGNLCSIFTKDGICKYKGAVDMDILEMYPLVGLNKYMMINANGFYEIRLAN